MLSTTQKRERLKSSQDNPKKYEGQIIFKKNEGKVGALYGYVEVVVTREALDVHLLLLLLTLMMK